MVVPSDRRYSQTHEWFKVDGTTVTIGITQFAADQLTDITYVDLPKVGAAVEGGSHFGEIESVKATGELYTAVTGTVKAVNTRLADEPGLVNSDPFGAGVPRPDSARQADGRAGVRQHDRGNMMRTSINRGRPSGPEA